MIVAPLCFIYRNHRGDISARSVTKPYMWHGMTEYHSELQWFMRAIDTGKNDIRDFAVKDILCYISEDDYERLK
jgi:hypothetical protein